MASSYEAYKVRELVTAYRSNPTMFTDDQLDQLEALAYDNGINFKRFNSEFNLNRAIRQSFAGFAEGFTTFDLMSERPRNTGEAIFRQIGHLVGFAPGIAKAPILAASKVAQRVAGKKGLSPLSSTLQRSRFTQAALDHIDILSTKSVPMLASRASKYGFDKILTKTGADSAEFLKRGTAGRQIADEAVGLAFASGISNFWKGEDAVLDGFIGGAIAGGAFGGIGNFVSIGNLYKGSPQQIERANQMLRAGVGSLITGLPSTLADEPTEMQIYNYLLGGYFGYNARPAVDREASKWFNNNRDPKENFRPEESKDFNNISKEARDYIRYEHPMGYESSNNEAGGSSGVALRYLRTQANRNGQNINFRQEAIKHFERNNLEYTERDILDYYRSKAMQLYESGRNEIRNAVQFKSNVYNNEQVDIMDTVDKEVSTLGSTAKRILKSTDKYETSSDIVQVIKTNFENSNNDIEVFRTNLKNEFGNAITPNVNKALTQYFIDKSTILQPIDLPYVLGKNTRLRLVDNERINDVTIREKAPQLPIQKFLPDANIRYMTHAVIPTEKGNKAVKILEQKLVDNKIVYSINKEQLKLINDVLASNNRYIYSANKDKLNVFTSEFRDDGYTIDDIFNILSRSGRSVEKLQKDYDDALQVEYDLFGKSENVADIFRRKFISNVVNETQLEGIPVEDAYRFIQEDSPFLKNVVDFNKRTQMFSTRSFYMTPSSFRDVADTNQGQTYNIILTNDRDVANTDGGTFIRDDFLNARNRVMGLNEKETGADKPVAFHRTPFGIFAEKSAGFRAMPAMQDFMKQNKIHEIVYTSSAKRKGDMPITDLAYGKDGKYTSDNVRLIQIPITSLQINSGTYENVKKDTESGQSIPLQFYGQTNSTQAPEFLKPFIEKILIPSNKGSDVAVDIVNRFNNNEIDIETFAKEYNDNNLDLFDLPLDFARNKLMVDQSEPISIFLMDKLMKSDSKFFLDEPINENIELDNDSSFADYHSENELLSNVTSGTHVPRRTLSFIKNNYQNALRKYFTKRITNPKYKYSSKSWLQPYEIKEAVQFIEFDPIKSGDRTIKYGEIYLNEGHRQMPVVFRNEQLTLGQLWSKYNRDYSKGLSKEALAEYDEALTFLTIRVPADSISGIRALRFRGWTNQKGAGSLLHPKDKEYSGGADHDSDSIKIFQGLGNELIDHYKRNKDERIRWEQDKPYVDKLNKGFENPNMSKQLKEGFENKFNIFSPSYRFLAGRNSSTGKDGLGFGLAGKNYLMNIHDYIKSKGGSIQDGGLTIRVKDEKSFKEFLDKSTMIVNKSADSSKDPTILPYNKHRDLIFKTLFDITDPKGNPIQTYDRFIKFTKPKAKNDRAIISSAIIDAVRLNKPQQTSFDSDGVSSSKTLFEYIEDLNSVKQRLGDEGLDQVNIYLNRQLQETFAGGLNFGEINKVQKLLYDELNKSYVIQKTGQLKIRDNKKKQEEYLSKHFDIITEELSFRSSNEHIKKINSDPNQALDIFGKDIGQYATLELLTKQFVDIQNAFSDKGRLVNVVDDVYPNIKKEAFDVKRKVIEVFKDPERDNAMNLDIDARIRRTMERLQEIERTNGLQNGLLQDYFGYWLLSPIKQNLNPNKPAEPLYYKMLHSSRAIDPRTKKNFYNKMDEIYNRVLKEDDRPIQIGRVREILDNSTINSNAKTYQTLNEIVSEGKLKNLALNKRDIAEVERLQNRIDETSVMSVDFNNWFTQFIGSQTGQLRDVSTITMDDIRFINNWYDSVNTKKGLEFGLKYWYQAPMTTAQQMQAMNLQSRGMTVREQVLTSKGAVPRDVTYIYSPIESIARYIQATESNQNKYNLLKDSMRSGLSKELGTISDKNKRNKYIDNIIDFREGKKSIDQIDSSLDKNKFNRLNDEITKFNKDMWEFWVTTKDISGKEYDWKKIDVDHQYGKINSYIAYDKNGRFDFKLFDRTVLNQLRQNDSIINNVGIDGILRYRYEYKLEKSLLGVKGDKKQLREAIRKDNPFNARRKRNYDTYIHHSIRNVDEGLQRKQAEWIDRQDPKVASIVARDIAQDNPFLDNRDRIIITDDPKIDFEQSNGTMASPLRKRGDDPIPFKRNQDLFDDYQSALIKGYFRNLMKFKAQKDIDRFLFNMKDYKPSVPEKNKFTNLYKGISKSEIPDKYRYNNYVDVWADFLRMYTESSMGYQTSFSTRMKTDQGKKLLHLNKKNLFYLTSDEVMANNLEKIYRSRFGRKEAIPFFNSKAIPKNREARQVYFYNVVRNLGATEAKYQLLSLLANTGSYSTNIFGGGAMTAGSAGIRNIIDAQRNSVIRPLLLQDSNGSNKVFMKNGTPVTNKKMLSKWLEENGFYDNYIQNEFEVNPEVKARFKELGINIKNFSRELITALKSKKGERDQSAKDVLNKYGVSDTITKAGGFLMQESERVNRKNAFLSHALQTVKGFGQAGKDMTIADPYVFQQALKGIEMTQFLYQNAFRPPFMATTTGKVLNRFKLFAFNSVRVRKEFYKQAKAQGLKPNTKEYEAFKNTFTIDTWMYILGAAFMFSIFDTVLPPPWDWIQAFADYTFGTKEQKKLAYFDDPLGPLNILKPPIARIPEAGMELLTGNWDEFTGYTMYTLLPFGRGIRQAVQLSDDRVGRGVERAPEILFRIPYNKFINRIERAKTDKKRRMFIDELLEES